MKGYFKGIVYTLILTLLIPMLLINDVKAKPKLDIQAKASILVDAKTGKIIYGHNYDTPLAPASMTKMMSEYLIFEAIEEGKISWDDVVTTGEYGHWMGKYGGSRVYLAQGESRTIKELMYAIAVYSANDATVVLAEHIAGSETNFVDLMNKKAKEFGMTQTQFVTSTGFPADSLEKFRPDFPGDNLMSARDAAILGWHIVNDFPDALTFTSTPILNFRQGETNELKDLPNWNWMLPGVVKSYEYPGLDGLKTGFTSEAGYNFTGTAMRDGVRFITVVMGTSSEGQRFRETKKLLDYGFANYESVNLLKAKEAIPGEEYVPVEKGKKTEIEVITRNNLEVTVKKGEAELYAPVVIPNESIVAPIKSGDVLGTVSYTFLGDEQYEYLTEQIKEMSNVDLIAKEDLEKGSAIRLFFRKIIGLFKSIFNGILG